MFRTCRKSLVDMLIDVRDGQGHPRHFRWTRRRHGLDQSILIRTNVDNQGPLSFKHLKQLKPYRLYVAYRDSELREKKHGHHK